MLLFFKWYQEWFIDCDYIPSQSQIDAMEDAWNGAIEATQQAAQQSSQADGARWQCQKDGFMNRHDLQKCSLCGLPRRLAAQQSERYCPNCRVALVGDKCGKCGVQWTRS